ncbi:MAG: hypothetical protein K2V38_12345, partial [Gemmataceae bacterium]|nr:hypothetical protein [Gemmataceae bacterium]
MTRLAWVVMLLGCCAGTGKADTLPTFVDVPGTYSPGTAFSFKVTVPELFDFANFRVDLLFDTDIANPPLFVSAVAPGSQYVFPSAANFQSTSTRSTDSPQVILTIQGSTSSVLDTQPGVNDTLATVTVTPGTALTGNIRLSIGGDSRFEFNREITNYGPPAPVTIAGPPTPPGGGGNPGGGNPPGGNPVPTPPGVALLALGGAILVVRRRMTRT